MLSAFFPVAQSRSLFHLERFPRRLNFWAGKFAVVRVRWQTQGKFGLPHGSWWRSRLLSRSGFYTIVKTLTDCQSLAHRYIIVDDFSRTFSCITKLHVVALICCSEISAFILSLAFETAGWARCSSVALSETPCRWTPSYTGPVRPHPHCLLLLPDNPNARLPC